MSRGATSNVVGIVSNTAKLVAFAGVDSIITKRMAGMAKSNSADSFIEERRAKATRDKQESDNSFMDV